MEEALKACVDVNRHLASELERVNLEKDSYAAHVQRLRHRLKPSLPHDHNHDHDHDQEHAPEEEQPKTHIDSTIVPFDYTATKDWSHLSTVLHGHGLAIDPGQVTVGIVAGQGAFGITHKGLWRGAECAVKMVQLVPSPTTTTGEHHHEYDDDVESASAAEAFARELLSLSSIRHKNVVALYGAVIQPPEKTWIVTEWLPGGTLSQWLHGAPGARRPPPRSLLERLRMALDIACGMEVLEQHEPPILHRDLKPTNVLIDGAGRAKIADMGLSRVLTQDALLSLTPETGSYLYMAPEVVRHELYATQADVWSWAVCTSELLTGMKPYSERHLTPIQVALKVADSDGFIPAVPATCPPGVAELLVSALDKDPLARPSFAVVAAVMRKVVEEEERKEAMGGRGVGGSGGESAVVAAWNRWMVGSSKSSGGGGS